ncbi:MtrAB system histidine kinase MtrB [Actinomyces sp. MRS3W]|uniref:MtrAB system histidine kinase MtrB n=1 Tax=Actinomyces sp. MRS3W TaxID=2800796 RepID=UPI0028FD0539|nr:MtrAB system histidine kinase MtrB [Actinomyces sp. MRS3W]MDU0349548.1 MtrAB system histidine kinase MtrB [Actinomyces sp. MRS3W]
MDAKGPGRRTRRHGGVRSLWKSARRSLATSMVLFATAAGVVLIVVLLVAVTATIRDDVFTGRRTAILADARQRVASAQAAFDAAPVDTAADLTTTAQAQLASMNDSFSGAGGVGVLLRRSSGETATTVINGLATDPDLTALLTDDLISQVDAGEMGAQYSQSVGIPNGDGTDPGIVVGSRISLPLAGSYNLFLVYTLAPEQHVIDLATRAIVVAGAGFLLILIIGLWQLTSRVLIPIRRASLAAQRLAAGHLNERLPVVGENEIASLSRSFNNMADSLEAQIQAWENLSKVEKLFVSDVSHELRTPLASIRLAAEQIWQARDEIEDPFAVRSLDILMREIDRFEQMLSDLLEISRIDSGRVQLRAAEADLIAVLRGVLDLVAVHVEASGSPIRLHLPDAPVIAEVDVARVDRILRNLIVNALEHAEGSPIDITIAANDDAVAVRVRDHGVGMSPDVVKKVFDRFYRADPSRKRTLGGTGLGLSISLEDAVLHGGTLTAWGWPADGASFLLTLPRRLGPDATPGTMTGPGPLDVIPDDAPAVSRGARGANPTADQPSPLTPSPASRRSDVDREDDGADAVEPETPSMPGRITVLGPGESPTARTPEDVEGRRKQGEGRR